MNLFKIIYAFIFCCSVTACNSNDKEQKTIAMEIKTADISYSADTVNMNGYVAYDAALTGKLPVVLIIHEWWGLNDYAKSRARQLAQLGYLAMAVDMYGDRKQGGNPEDAGKLATPFYQQPQMAKDRFDAALARVKTMPQADTSQVVAIGYCFGGAMVLNMARMGSPLKGIVSFHGNLIGVPLDKSKLTAKILVCHGGADPFVPAAEVAAFKKEMDDNAIPYSFKAYEGATHAFTNPDATEMGKRFSIPIEYNAAADTASWNDMKAFFKTIFK